MSTTRGRVVAGWKASSTSTAPRRNCLVGREVSAGEVEIEKDVETEHVPSRSGRHEEVEIERHPVEEASTPAKTAREEEIHIPIPEEEAVVEKRPAREELVVRKRPRGDRGGGGRPAKGARQKSRSTAGSRRRGRGAASRR